MRSKQAELREALTGLINDHQRFMLASLLRHVEHPRRGTRTARRGGRLPLGTAPRPARATGAIPGIGRATGEQILAEITPDLSRFPSAKHLASWAKVCPGNHESGGVRKNARAGPGSRWLRSILIEAAHAAARNKESYFASMYHRIVARRGKKRAALAVAHAILVTIYHLITRGTSYQDLGPNHYDERRKTAALNHAVRRIHNLGYHVTLEAT